MVEILEGQLGMTILLVFGWEQILEIQKQVKIFDKKTLHYVNTDRLHLFQLYHWRNWQAQIRSFSLVIDESSGKLIVAKMHRCGNHLGK